MLHEATITFALDVALGDRLLEQAEPLRDRQHRLLARVVHDEHVQLVVERRRAADDVEMTEGRRVEGSGDDGDPAAHGLSLSDCWKARSRYARWRRYSILTAAASTRASPH